MVWSQSNRAKINEYVNKEIVLIDDWAGQSITIKKANKDYYILRKYFGSGEPVIDSVKYKGILISDYQIRFSEIMLDKNTCRLNNLTENFKLSVGEHGLELYLNGLKVNIDQKITSYKNNNR